MAHRASFYPATLLAASLLATPLAAADPPKLGVFHRDVDGDGAQERIVIVNQMRSDGSLAIFVRTYRPDGSVLNYEQKILPPNADLTGDGIVDSRDLALVVGAWGGDGPADLNRDGVVDSEDLALVLGQFGAVVALARSDCQAMRCVQYGDDCFCGGGGGPNDPDEGDPNDPAGLPTTDVPTDGDDGGQNPGNHPPPAGGGDPQPPPPTVSVDDAPRCIGVWAPDDTDGDDTNDTDDLPTLTADGSDGGGTYSWTIIQDDDRVEFVDPDPDDEIGAGAGKTVILRGMKPSEEIDDVQIQVVHTSAEGAVSEPAMIELTVISVLLTFRPVDPLADPREVWSAGNDVNAAQFPGLGLPSLGFIRLGDPPGATGFFKNMEITAAIQPCIGGLDCAFDFKRLRQGFVGSALREINGSVKLEPAPLTCLPPAWCDDDLPGNADEDLALAAPNDCDLFSIDTPGIRSTLMPSCQAIDETVNQNPQLADFIAFVNTLNFREWLVVDGFRASRTLNWRARTEIGCDADGLFVETSNLAGNSLGAIDMPIPEIGENQSALSMSELAVVFSTPPIHDVGELRQVLHDFSDPTSTIGTGDRLWQHAEAIASNPHLRPVAVARLVDAAKDERPMFPGMQWISPRVKAIDLLGHMRAGEAVDELIDMVGLVIDDPFQTDPPNIGQRRPVVGALVRIGAPAIGPILERAGTATDEEWEQLHVVLERIDRDTLAVRQGMETLLEVTDDETAKKRLEEFLATPEPRRPAPPRKKDQTKQTPSEPVALGVP